MKEKTYTEKNLEIEVKVKISHENLENTLEHLGFTKGTTVYEKDTYFNSAHLDLKEADKALRIREHRNLDTAETSFTLNFKGPKLDKSTMTREETEFEIPSFSHGELLFNGLGFFAAGGVEKKRIHYTKDEITCCLDEVTGLGEFLEIEIVAPGSRYDEAIEKIKALLQTLGLSMADTVRHSYLSML